MRGKALLLALAALPGAAAASNGTAGDDFLSTRPSAEASAMGGAFVARGEDLDAVTYNPAGLVGLTGPSLDFLQFSQFAGVSLEDLSYGQPFSFGSLGANLIYQGQPAIANPQALDAPVVAWNLAVGLSYAGSLAQLPWQLPGAFQKAQWGVTGKYVQAHLGEFDAYDGALDLGVRAPLEEGIEVGASLLNLGPGVRFVSVADPLPETLLLGLSRRFDPLWGNQVSVAADYDAPFNDDSRFHFGVEDRIFDAIALRAGYVVDNNSDSLDGATFGLGIQLVQDGLTFRLDYAYLPLYFSGFGGTESQQQFQLSLVF